MPTSIRHRFLAIDEGLATLLHVDETCPGNDWTVPIGHPQARDMQLVGGNRVLIGHHHGWSEFDLTDGRVVAEFTSFEGVTAARRQPDGHTILAGVNIAEAVGVVILELDRNHAEVHRAVYPGDYVRLIRQTARGTILMSCNDRIREGDREGNYLREFHVDVFYHAWKAICLPSGNLLVSAGYGAFMVELDPQGGIVRKFGGKEVVPAAVNPFFYAMFQLLEDGHVVMANWQGHGEGFGESGVQLLEFDSEGKTVWNWGDSKRISSLQGVLVIDSLDTAVLHDEREGIMQPV